jgi:hypothetical protein
VEIYVLLYNHSENPYNIHRGDKITKLICEKIYYPEFDQVEKLDETWRGTRGFGSTGQNYLQWRCRNDQLSNKTSHFHLSNDQLSINLWIKDYA